MSRRLVGSGAVAIGLVGLGAFIVSSRVESGGDVQSFCGMLDVHQPIADRDAQFLVFVQAGASDEQIAAVASAIDELIPAATWRWTTAEEDDDARELFEDQPYMAEAAAVGLLPSTFTVSVPHRVDVERLDQLRELAHVHSVTEPLLQPDATAREILSAVFLTRFDGEPSLAMSVDDDTALGVWVLTRPLVIDPGSSDGSADLEDDLRIVATGLEALAELETPDSAVSSATERVLAAYDEYCTG